MKKIFKVGSMFAGVGGICLGFLQAYNPNAEYQLVWANEIDEYACETYRNNFHHTLLEGDINKVLNPNLASDNIEKKYYENLHNVILSTPIDILNGGFPCQAFSIAGKQKGFDDDRGNLFLSIIELINQLGKKFYKPRILLLENVKNLKSHDSGNTYTHIKNELQKAGYIIKEAIINTMNYSNLPQNRERLYIIGFLNEYDANNFNLFDNLQSYEVYKSKENRINDIKKILNFSITDNKYFYTKEKYPKYFISQNDFQLNNNGKCARINLDEEINEMYQFYQIRRGMYVRKNQNNVCPTLTANMGTGGHNVPLILTPTGIRKITPRETFNLQGFPNNYTLPTKFKERTLSDSHLYKQAGNSVSVPIIQMITEYLLNILV